MRVYSRFRCISGLSPKQVASVIFRQFLNEYSIVFDDVHFTYPGTDREILSGVSFEIKEGEHSALVGGKRRGKIDHHKAVMRVV